MVSCFRGFFIANCFLSRRTLSLHRQHYDRGIVAKLPTAIGGNRVQQPAPDVFGAATWGVMQSAHHPLFTKLFSARVFGFGHAVGEEHEAVTGLQLKTIVR